MLKRLTFIVLFATAFTAGSALADLPESSGLYMDLNLGAAYLNNSSGDVLKSIFTSHEDDISPVVAGIFDVGYKFTDFVAAEIGINLYGDKDDQYGVNYEQNYSIDIALKGIYPIVEGFDAFGKIGAALVHTEQSYVGDNYDYYDITGAAPYLAMGVDYYFTPNLSMIFQGSGNFSTDTNDGPVPSFVVFTLGVSYLFTMG